MRLPLRQGALLIAPLDDHTSVVPAHQRDPLSEAGGRLKALLKIYAPLGVERAKRVALQQPGFAKRVRDVSHVRGARLFSLAVQRRRAALTDNPHPPLSTCHGQRRAGPSPRGRAKEAPPL